MRARDVLDALDRIELFRAQAGQQAHRGRIEAIGGDLDSALSLLNLRQSRHSCVVDDVLNRRVGTVGVVQGVDRVVLDWSTGVIAKLSAGLLRPSSVALARAAIDKQAAPPTGGENKAGKKKPTNSASKKMQDHNGSDGGGDDGIGGDRQQQVIHQSELHDRNARRWLSDRRTWEVFVRSLRGCAAADPNTQLPQSSGVAVLHAAVFAVRDGNNSDSDKHSAGDENEAKKLSASKWAFVAICTLCGGTTGAGNVGTPSGGLSIQEDTLQRSPDNVFGIVSQLKKKKNLPPSSTNVVSQNEARGDRGRGGRPLLRIMLDAYASFLNGVVREHARRVCGGGVGSGGVVDTPSEGGLNDADMDAPTRLEEGALVELLRFQVVLQGHHSNRRKVFSTCCAKLMGPLFEILPESEVGATTTAGEATSSQLTSAATSLIWDALFHEEHLDGFREAFTATEAASAAPSLADDGGSDAVASPPAADVGEGAAKKRRRKGKKDRASSSAADGDGGGGDARAVASGGGGTARRRACYQQQVFEEMVELAGGAGAETEEASKRTRLGSMRGAPLLLEGFIVRMTAQAQRNNKNADIHQPISGSVSPAGAQGGVLAIGGKRSRSSPGILTHTHGGGYTSSPAALMFKMWTVLTGTLAPLSSTEQDRATGGDAELSSSSLDLSISADGGKSRGLVKSVSSYLLPFLRSSNAMLQLLLRHDIYRVNEDWGGRKFRQLQIFAATMFDLAGRHNTAPTTTMDIGGDDDDLMDGPAHEFLKAFHALLGMNHNILHDNLRSLLRMTFEWAAIDVHIPAVDSPGATVEVGALEAATAGIAGNDDVVGGGQVKSLRPLAVALIVSLVDTYGRLRQMDHLVQALFGAICDNPVASAATLRGDECTSALGRAFQRLPEGQIESMWHVFAVHLRATWTLPADSTAAGARAVDDAGGAAGHSGAHGEEQERRLLAKELDGELFVLFLRNLHVTSSVAAGVGELCARLAEESLRTFSAAVQHTATTAAPESPPSSKKKKRKGKQGGPDRNAGIAETVVSEPMLDCRPALDIHGWLLDLSTRCRFWSAILDSSGSALSVPESIPIAPAERTDDELPFPPTDMPAIPAEGSLPRIIAIAVEAVKRSNTARRSNGGQARGIGQVGDAGAEGEFIRGEGSRFNKIMRTLQQVAVHRVQQIYARLNGVAVPEAMTGSSAAANGVGAGRGQFTGAPVATTGAAVGLAGFQQGAERLEEEARALVAFACGSARENGRGGDPGVRGSEGPVVWGDEDGSDNSGATWSMMMPYLPVWVGFAAREQVSAFLGALFSRCASDMLLGRGGKESAPLRLLTDASFYEMEAVAQCAPAVILCHVYRAAKGTINDSGAKNRQSATTAAHVSLRSSLDVLVRAISSLGVVIGRRRNNVGSTSDSESEMGTGDGARSPEEDGEEEEDSAADLKNGEAEQARRDTGGERPLLEGCCLILLTERFPVGFLSPEAVAGVMLAADALDSVCTRVLGRKSNKQTERGIAAALVDASTALRRLMLRLGISMSLNSPVSGYFSPGAAIVRVASLVGDGSGRGRAGARLLRSSAKLASFLAASCFALGQTRELLEAVSMLGEGSSTWGVEFGGGNEDKSSNDEPRLVLLHGLLSGIVAGETNRLSAAATAAAAAAFDSDDTPSEDENDDMSDVAAASILSPADGSDEPPALFALVARLVALMPSPEQQRQQQRVAPSWSLESGSIETRVLGRRTSSPSLLLVWGDAVRLSFLGTSAEFLVFGPAKGVKNRSRSRWIEDATCFVRAIAEATMTSDETIFEAAAAATPFSELKGADQGGLSRPEPGGPGVSERSACCHLLRAICGCSHLLDRPLPRHAMVVLVEAFLFLSAAGKSSACDGCARRRDDESGDPVRQWQGETLLLQTALCLLVQHAPEAHMHTVVETLLETLEGKRRPRSVPDAPIIPSDDAESKTAGNAVHARAGYEDAGSPSRPGGTRNQGSGREVGGVVTCQDNERVVPTAVTLVRLVAQAGRGGAFVATMRTHGLRLVSALCRQLRLAAQGDHYDYRDRGGRYNHECRGRWDQELVDMTDGLDALEALLSRLPYASVSARVVSVVLGSLEPATSLASAAVRFARHCKPENDYKDGVVNAGGTSIHRSLACFSACCRVLGTLLQHYAKKLYSCTPPFAALCRSLLRLFFCLAAGGSREASHKRHGGPTRTTTTTRTTQSKSGAGSSPDGAADGGLLLSTDDQVAAASALSRVLQQFLPHKGVLKKYSAFLLVDYVSLAGSIALEPAPRAALLAGIFAVMEACTPREMRQLQGLLGGLPTGTGLEVLRSLYEEYQRQHKYTGKM